ncbi:hypothetical protein [Hymenobacter siberiensis]|uniref:hypothetical protein n=1 Tax=Hymenobacter siberiensis TaxID=2848396 RepID=UPI001C1DD31F|nr:hypothetical protein [Hymenobacter siberiensis]
MSNQSLMTSVVDAPKLVVLKSCYGKTNHKLRLEPCRDGRTGKWLGVADLSEEEKRNSKYVVEPGVTFLEIVDGFTFDLTKLKDATDWQWVKECPQIAGAREETNHAIKGEEQEDFTSYEGADKEFFVFDEQAEEEREEKRYSKERKAENYVGDLSNTMIYRVARLLGSNMDGARPSAVRNYLSTKARKHPQQVLDVQKDPAQKSRLFMYAALDKEVIRKRGGVFYYNDIALGTTDEQVLLWLGEDRNYTLVRGIANAINPAEQAKATISQANAELFEQTLQEPAAPVAPVLQPYQSINPAGQPEGPAFTNEDDDDALDLSDIDANAGFSEPASLTPAPANLTRAQREKLAREAKK